MDNMILSLLKGRSLLRLGILLYLCICGIDRVASVTEKIPRNAEVKIDAVPGKISLSPVNRVEIPRPESTPSPQEVPHFNHRLNSLNRSYESSNVYTNPSPPSFNHNLDYPTDTSPTPRVDEGKTVMIGSENDTFFVVKLQGPTSGDSDFSATNQDHPLHYEDQDDFGNPFYRKNGEFPSPNSVEVDAIAPHPSGSTPEDFGLKQSPNTDFGPFYPILPEPHQNLIHPAFNRNPYHENLSFVNPYVYPPHFQRLSNSFPNAGNSDCRHSGRRRNIKRTVGYSPGGLSARAYLKKRATPTVMPPNVVKHTIKVYEREVDDDDGLFSGSDDTAPSGSGGFFGLDFSDLAARTKRAPIISQIMDSIMGMVNLSPSDDHLPPRVISSLTGLPSGDKYLYLPINEAEAPEYIPVMENIVVKHGTVIKKNPPFPPPLDLSEIPSVQPSRRPKLRTANEVGSREVPWSITALPPPLPTVSPSSRTAKNHLPWALQPLPPPLPTIHPSSSINYQLLLLQPATFPSEPGTDATTAENGLSYGSIGNGTKSETQVKIRPGSGPGLTIKLNPKRNKGIELVKSIDLTNANNFQYYNKINNYTNKGHGDNTPAYTDIYRHHNRPGRTHAGENQPYNKRPDQQPLASYGEQSSYHRENYQFEGHPNPPPPSNEYYRPATSSYRRPISKPPQPPSLLLKIVPHDHSMIIESPVKFNLELRETGDRPAVSCINCSGRSGYGRSVGRSSSRPRIKGPPIPGASGKYREGKTSVEFFKPVVIDIDDDGSQRLMTEQELVNEDSRHFRSSFRNRKSKSAPRPRAQAADSVRLPLNLHETYESKVPNKVPAPFDLEFDQSKPASSVSKANSNNNSFVPTPTVTSPPQELHLRITKKEFS